MRSLLRSLRKSRGFTQVQLARLAGITPEHLCMLERGHYTIMRLDTLQRLAKALKVSPALLLDSELERKQAS